MATTLETIHTELESLFPSILINEYSDLIAEDFVNSPNSLLMDEMNRLKGGPGVVETEWKALYDILTILDQCESSNSGIYYNEVFSRLISKYPSSLTFQFLRVYYTNSNIITGDFNGDVIRFYKDLFENHPEFFDNTISDFLDKSNVLESILLLVNPPIALLNLIEDATKRYSLSNLKFALAQLCNVRKDYHKALSFFLHFAGQVETEKPLDNYTLEQYGIAISNIANISFYEIKDYENASLYVDVCHSQYKENGEDIYSFDYLFLNPMLIRLRLCISKKDNEGFKQNYELLRSKIGDPDFDAIDIDDIKEFASGLKM